MTGPRALFGAVAVALVATVLASSRPAAMARSPSYGAAASSTSPAHPLRRVAIDDPDTYWTSAGFVEMTSPIRPPSRDGKESIRVWLRIPDGRTIGIEPGEGAAPLLSYPEGTVADRVDLRHGADPRSVSDVRGTSFTAERGELFHVLRRLDGDAAVRLSGVEWRRGDEEAQASATQAMLLALGRTFDEHGGAGLGRALDRFEGQNDCAGCHLHRKPERVIRQMAGPSPNRGTDASGLFAIQTVLRDEAPLERHRARDMNADDPFVEASCGAPGARPRLVSGARGARHFECDGDPLPMARYRMREALDAGEAHAREVCRSRAYLIAHMDDEARAAFASAAAECGLR